MDDGQRTAEVSHLSFLCPEDRRSLLDVFRQLRLRLQSALVTLQTKQTLLCIIVPRHCDVGDSSFLICSLTNKSNNANQSRLASFWLLHIIHLSSSITHLKFVSTAIAIN